MLYVFRRLEVLPVFDNVTMQNIQIYNTIDFSKQYIILVVYMHTQLLLEKMGVQILPRIIQTYLSILIYNFSLWCYLLSKLIAICIRAEILLLWALENWVMALCLSFTLSFVKEFVLLAIFTGTWPYKFWSKYYFILFELYF